MVVHRRRVFGHRLLHARRKPSLTGENLNRKAGAYFYRHRPGLVDRRAEDAVAEKLTTVLRSRFSFSFLMGQGFPTGGEITAGGNFMVS